MVHRKQGPRKGSLQFWPRKRSDRTILRVNWDPIISKPENMKKPGMLGVIGYKVAMSSAYVKDNTPDSMTKNKKIIVPVTIIECPSMRILSVRFYKNGKASKEVLNDHIEKEVARRFRMPGKKTNAKEMIEKIKKEGDFEDVRILVYSEVKKTGVKRTPDLAELEVAGNSKEDKLKFIEDNLGKEIYASESFESKLVDVRGLTKGKGLQGQVKRMGVHLRSHKAEKGQRRVGSIGPWHPARLDFHVAMPGQLGYFARVTYNSKIIAVKKVSEAASINVKGGFESYGNVKNECIIVYGSVQGPQKRQLLLTPALRPTKKQNKKQYELIELR